MFEGNALIRRLVRVGVLDESRMRLDYVLSLKIEDFLERRLQTQVFKSGLAKSIHHARVLIRQRHIRCVLPSPKSFYGNAQFLNICTGLVAKLLTSRRSSCDSTPKSTSTSPSLRRTGVVVRAVSSASVLPKLPRRRRVAMRRRSKCRSCSLFLLSYRAYFMLGIYVDHAILCHMHWWSSETSS